MRVAALAAAMLACACQPQLETAVDAAAPAGGTAAIGAVVAPAVDLSRRPVDELKASGSRALREGRLHAPAGDSAIEYWLEAKRRDPDDAALASAISDLQPYMLIACEQAIVRRDVAEAHRLHGLIAASDPGAPALQRLATAIAGAEADAEAEREQALRLAAEDAQRQREQAAARAAATQPAVAAAAPPTASPPATQQQRPLAVVEQPPVADGPARTSARPPSPPPGPTPEVAANPPAPPSSPPAARVPRLLHQPTARYPSAALSRRIEGAVQVAFTVLPDGSVAGARVVSATPPGLFDRSALAAVGNYRFEPVGRSVASAVTVRFTLNQ